MPALIDARAMAVMRAAPEVDVCDADRRRAADRLASIMRIADGIDRDPDMGARAMAARELHHVLVGVPCDGSGRWKEEELLSALANFAKRYPLHV